MALVSIRTSLKHFGSVADRLEKLKGKPFERAVTKALGAETKRLIQRQFVTERDPYGNRWQKKERKDGRKTLTGPTGRLQRRVKVSPVKLIVSFNTPYASFHQSGTSRMPQRLLFPDAGLPRTWKRAFGKIAKAAAKKALK